MAWSRMIEDLAPPAASLTLIEPARAFQHAATLVLGTLADRPEARFYAARTTSQPAANVILHDVVVDPETGLVFQAGEVVRWACYPPRPAEEEPARRRAALARPASRERLAYCGFNRHWRNHFHWLTQCVPAIAGYAADVAWPDGVLLLPPVNADQMRALHLSGADPANIETIDPACAIAVDRLVYSSLLTHQAAPSPFSRGVFDWMTTRVTPADRSESAAAIYISRADAANRPMRNEAECVALMIARGIEPVIASALTIEQKIAKFHAARLVVGAHGAGLANIVFCQPGSVVYELFPEHAVNLNIGPGVNLLAQQHGLHYWADVHPSHGSFRQFGHLVPWSADLDRVQRGLDAIELAMDWAH